MPAEEHQAIDVIEQGSVPRSTKWFRRTPIIGAMAVLTAVGGFLFSARDVPNDSGLPPPTAPPLRASPTSQPSSSVPAAPTSEPLVNAGGFGWLAERGSMRFYIDMHNAGPATIRIEKLRLPPSPGVTVTLLGIGNGAQGNPFTAPPSLGEGVELESGASTNLVLALEIDCDRVATAPGAGPPFDVTFTSAAGRLTQHFQPHQIPGGWLAWARKSACGSAH